MIVVTLLHREPAVAREIVDLQQIAYAPEAELLGFPRLPPLMESVSNIIASDERFSGVRFRSGLAGMVATEGDVDPTRISRLCVAPQHARRGIATLLLRHVLTEATRDISVSTARANWPAVALYTGLGSVVTESHVSPEGLPLVTLTRTLSQA
jgi:ribosomal protein S18 acetylase RimI-like enzyme